MPDCGLVYVTEEAGGFCRGHIKSETCSTAMECMNYSADTSTAGFPLQPRNSPPLKNRKNEKRRPTKAEKTKHDDEEEEEVKMEKREEQQKGDAQSPHKTSCQRIEKSSGGNGKKFQRADCCVY